MPMPTCTRTRTTLISLSSFGAAEVRRHGQAWFAQLAHRAGADGVEIRGELLGHSADHAEELQDIARRCPDLHRFYSCAVPLFTRDGVLNHAGVQQAIACAQWLKAGLIKFSIGNGADADDLALRALAASLQACSIPVVIENDQTHAAGTIFQLQRFFRKAAAVGLDFGLTFDIGNWHWVGECPQRAAAVFADRIRYVHTKGVQRQEKRWVATPLTASAAPWKTLLDSMPADCPWAFEYPLVGDDLLEVTRNEVIQLKTIQGERYVD